MRVAWQVVKLSVEPASADGRGAERRKLRFDAEVAGPGDAAQVLVLDLSEAGMMLHSGAEFAVGEIVQIELPEAGEVGARIVWRRSPLYGCEFLAPVARGAVSAALLRSPRRLQGDAPFTTDLCDAATLPTERRGQGSAAIALCLALVLAAAALFLLNLAGTSTPADPPLRGRALPATS